MSSTDLNKNLYFNLMDKNINPLNPSIDDLSMMIHQNGNILGYSSRTLIKNAYKDIKKNIDINLISFAKEIILLVFINPNTPYSLVLKFVDMVSNHVSSSTKFHLGIYLNKSIPKEYIDYRIMATGVDE